MSRIAMVQFINPVEVRTGNASAAYTKRSISQPNGEGIAVEKVDGGIELAWDGPDKEGKASTHRMLIPTVNIAAVRFAPEAVKTEKKEAKA